MGPSGFIVVNSEHPLPRTSPTKAVLPFTAPFVGRHGFASDRRPAPTKAENPSVFTIIDNQTIRWLSPYVRRPLTTSKKPQVATCPTHLVLSHDKPGWTKKCLYSNSVGSRADAQSANALASYQEPQRLEPSGYRNCFRYIADIERH